MILNVTTRISTITPSTLSTNGGRVTFAGTGLPATWPNSNFALTIQSGNTVLETNSFDTNPTALTLLLPPSSNGYTLTLITPLGDKLVRTVSVSSANTPSISLSSSSTVSSGTNTLTFTKSNLLAAVPQFV